MFVRFGSVPACRVGSLLLPVLPEDLRGDPSFLSNPDSLYLTACDPLPSLWDDRPYNHFFLGVLISPPS